MTIDVGKYIVDSIYGYGGSDNFGFENNNNSVDGMDGLLFIAFWLGGAALHTLYDLKIKPQLNADEEAERSRWLP